MFHENFSFHKDSRSLLAPGQLLQSRMWRCSFLHNVCSDNFGELNGKNDPIQLQDSGKVPMGFVFGKQIRAFAHQIHVLQRLYRQKYREVNTSILLNTKSKISTAQTDFSCASLKLSTVSRWNPNKNYSVPQKDGTLDNGGFMSAEHSSALAQFLAVCLKQRQYHLFIISILHSLQFESQHSRCIFE